MRHHIQPLEPRRLLSLGMYDGQVSADDYGTIDFNIQQPGPDRILRR